MNRILILFILSCFVCIRIVAQNIPIYISGTISDSSGKEIQNSYVKISSKSNGLILAYLNTGKFASFKTLVKIGMPDSITIEITNVGYKTFRSVFFVSKNDSLVLSVTLRLNSNILENVIINAPPVWVRGDTTFFKAEYFKQGEEKTLKDLLIKMPGFEVDDDENLLFKKKRVEKIFIDGEDIFAQKVKMLINNFPLHVINQIQALENQSNDPILKGLKNENKVFVNIALKKDIKLHAFGSGEIGLGTGGRYILKPVLFSLYKKIKLGYIGSVNSMGDGIAWRGEQETKYDGAFELEPWLIQSQGILTIGNFSNNRYITNRQFNNNFQLNLPSSKNVKQRLLASFFSDRQLQHTLFNSRILSDSILVVRRDSNFVINRPKSISVQHILEWQKNSKSLIKTEVQIYKDISIRNQHSIFQQSIDSNISDSKILNDWLTLAAKIDYSKRISASIGYKISAIYNHNQYNQDAFSVSNSWQSIFNLSSNYERLIQPIHLKNKSAGIGYELNVMKKNRIYQVRLFSKWQQYNFSRNLTFLSSNIFNKDTIIPSFSNNGLYDVVSFNADFSHSLKFGKYQLTLLPSAGYFKTKISEDLHSRNFQFPLYNITSTLKTAFTHKWIATLSTTIVQSQVKNQQLSSFLLPQNILNFTQTLQSQKPTRSLNGTASIAHSFKHSNLYLSHQASLSFVRNFRSAILSNSLKEIVQYTTDSFANIPTNQLSLYTSSSINKISDASIYTFGGGVTLNEGLIKLNQQLVKNKLMFSYLYISANKNWRKKYFIEGKWVQFFTNSTYTGNAAINESYISSLRLLLMQRLLIAKKINFIVNTEYYDGNLKAKDKSSLFFTDVEVSISLTKQKLYLSIKAENINNQKYYYSNKNSIISQSTYLLPIVKRSINVSAKYNL